MRKGGGSQSKTSGFRHSTPLSKEVWVVRGRCLLIRALPQPPPPHRERAVRTASESWSYSSLNSVLCSCSTARRSQQSWPRLKMMRPSLFKSSQSVRRLFLTFFCASFFPLSALSTHPCPGNFLPQKSPLSGTSDLLFLVEKRQPAGGGFWRRFWTRSPHRKKMKNLVFWRAKKGEFLGRVRVKLPKTRATKEPRKSASRPQQSHEKGPNTVFPRR